MTAPSKFDPFEAVLAFHRQFGGYVGPRPAIPDPSIVALRRKLVDEEVAELHAALDAGDLVQVADALADLLYVVYGAAICFGIDIRPVFEEVHRANMAKIGGPIRADGKVLKPEGWQPPNVRAVLDRARIAFDDRTGGPSTTCGAVSRDI